MTIANKATASEFFLKKDYYVLSWIALYVGSRKFYTWDGMSIIKCLFWNANDSIVKLMVSITSGDSLWYRPWYKNMTNYDDDN